MSMDVDPLHCPPPPAPKEVLLQDWWLFQVSLIVSHIN